MKCPLQFTLDYSEKGILSTPIKDCLKEECAWWDEGSSACAVWSIMSGLDALGKLFREIENKMPHEEQFRR